MAGVVLGAAVPDLPRLYVLPQRPARAVEAAEEPQVELVGCFRIRPLPMRPSPSLPIAMRWNEMAARDTVGWSEAVGARFTPEAALVSPDGEVVYRGRVNDLYRWANTDLRPKLGLGARR